MIIFKSFTVHLEVMEVKIDIWSSKDPPVIESSESKNSSTSWMVKVALLAGSVFFELIKNLAIVLARRGI